MIRGYKMNTYKWLSKSVLLISLVLLTSIGAFKTVHAYGTPPLPESRIMDKMLKDHLRKEHNCIVGANEHFVLNWKVDNSGTEPVGFVYAGTSLAASHCSNILHLAFVMQPMTIHTLADIENNKSNLIISNRTSINALGNRQQLLDAR